MLALCRSEESKRTWLREVLPVLQDSEAGRQVIQTMARQLADMTSFPNLKNQEDGKQMTQAAREAVQELRTYLERKDEQRVDQREQQRARERAQALRAESLKREKDLASIRGSFDGLLPTLGTSEGGYAFQDWFYDEFIRYWEVEYRRPYKVAGREIDGSITVGSVNYLVELKFTGEFAGAPDIDVFRRKVVSKADNTMGVMLSVSGFTSVAKDAASGERTPLLLMDHGHLMLALTGAMSFQDVVRRIHRNASHTGSAFLAASDFGG